MKSQLWMFLPIGLWILIELGAKCLRWVVTLDSANGEMDEPGEISEESANVL
jgi:hypothetical protein